MGVADDFYNFCKNLVITRRDSIAYRCGEITKRLNKDFYGSDSNTYHSFYGGSYGRGTAIDSTSDVDLLFVLPNSVYHQYNAYIYNGQSALLQAVRTSIKNRYSNSDIGGDGQVVVIPFGDGITFEVVPVFLNQDGTSYTYPDSNGGGKWRVTNPKAEIDAIAAMDINCNGNLKPLCKIMRAWKVEWNVPISGMLIDTLAYNFIQKWSERGESYIYYDWMSRDFFQYLSEQKADQTYWCAPGSGQYVWRKGNFEYKAKQCHNLALEAIQQMSNNYPWSSRQTWRKIYGTSFPE